MASHVSDLQLAQWIKQFQQDKGYSPTIREMCDAHSWRSTSTGHRRFGRLLKLGLVSVAKRPSRRELVVREGV